MKNQFKVKTIIGMVGIVALAAVIGFPFVACDNGTTGEDDGGGGDKTIWFDVNDIPSGSVSVINFYSTDELRGQINIYSALAPIIFSLTEDDIVFSDTTVATLNSDSIQGNETAITLRQQEHITVLKSGTVTVSIKDKDGYKFVKTSFGKDQITFTKK